MERPAILGPIRRRAVRLILVSSMACKAVLAPWRLPWSVDDSCQVTGSNFRRSYDTSLARQKIKGTDPFRSAPRKATREVQRRLLQRAGRRVGGTAGDRADHTGLIGVEATLPGSAGARRIRRNRITGIGSVAANPGKREPVAALGAGRENAVDQVRAARGRAGRRSQLRQRCRVSDRLIGRRVRHAGGVDRTQRTYCGRFIGRHTRTEQVRDGNRRDDQNDSHDDQQFDKGETLLILLHFSNLLWMYHEICLLNHFQCPILVQRGCHSLPKLSVGLNTGN